MKESNTIMTSKISEKMKDPGNFTVLMPIGRTKRGASTL